METQLPSLHFDPNNPDQPLPSTEMKQNKDHSLKRRSILKDKREPLLSLVGENDSNESAKKKLKTKATKLDARRVSFANHTLIKIFDKTSEEWNKDSPIVGEVKDSKLPKAERDDTFAFSFNHDGEKHGLKLDMTLDKITSFAMPNLSSVASAADNDYNLRLSLDRNTLISLEEKRRSLTQPHVFKSPQRPNIVNLLNNTASPSPSPAPKHRQSPAKVASSPGSKSPRFVRRFVVREDEENEEENMSLDMSLDQSLVGGIIGRRMSLLEDQEMEFTENIGRILAAQSPESQELASSPNVTQTLDFTENVGRIIMAQSFPSPKEDTIDRQESLSEEMEFTENIGRILPAQSPEAQEMDNSPNVTQTLDFTENVGGIIMARSFHTSSGLQALQFPQEQGDKRPMEEETVDDEIIEEEQAGHNNMSLLEDQDMEFTENVGSPIRSSELRVAQSPREQVEEEQVEEEQVMEPVEEEAPKEEPTKEEQADGNMSVLDQDMEFTENVGSPIPSTVPVAQSPREQAINEPQNPLAEEAIVEEKAIVEEEPVIPEEPDIEEKAIAEKEAIIEEEAIIEKKAIIEEEALVEEEPVIEEKVIIEKEAIVEEEPVVEEDSVAEEFIREEETDRRMSLLEDQKMEFIENVGSPIPSSPAPSSPAPSSTLLTAQSPREQVKEEEEASKSENVILRDETGRLDDLVSQLEREGAHILGLESEPMDVDLSNSEIPCPQTPQQKLEEQPAAVPSPVPTPVVSAVKKAKPTSQKGGAYKQRLSLAAHRASQAHLLSSWHDENDEDVEDNGGVNFKSFLSSAGVRFLDNLTSNRRETMLPALAAPSESVETIEDMIKAASVLLPELEVFKAAANELVGYTSEAREATKELEQTLNKQSPKLFHDLLEANETDKPRMQKHLKNLKNNSRLHARHTWYKWREELTATIAADLMESKQCLEADEEILAKSESALEKAISQLEEETQKTTSAIQKARQWIEERNFNLANKDQINELHGVILQNSGVIDVQQEASRGLESSLAKEMSTLAAANQDKEDLSQEIERLRPLCQVPETASQDQVCSLRSLYSEQMRMCHWKPANVSSDYLEFDFGGKWLVGVKIVPNEEQQSQEYTIVAKISSPPHPKKSKKSSRVFELIESLETAFCVGLTSGGVSKMLHDLSFQYSRLSLLESELAHLERLFPMEVATESLEGKTTSLTYSVGFFSLKKKSKFSLCFHFRSPVNHPYGQLDWTLQTAYGDVDEDTISQLFSEVSPGPNALVEVCDKIHRMCC